MQWRVLTKVLTADGLIHIWIHVTTHWWLTIVGQKMNERTKSDFKRAFHSFWPAKSVLTIPEPGGWERGEGGHNLAQYDASFHQNFKYFTLTFLV